MKNTKRIKSLTITCSSPENKPGTGAAFRLFVIYDSGLLKVSFYQNAGLKSRKLMLKGGMWWRFPLIDPPPPTPLMIIIFSHAPASNAESMQMHCTFFSTNQCWIEASLPLK